MPNVSLAKNTLAIAGVLVAVVFFGAGYFTSSKLAGPKAPGGMQFAPGGNGAQRQNAQMRNRNSLGGFINGELVKKDAGSFSLKQRDGSMKLVLITSSTKAMKMSEGTLDEFNVGQQVMVTGSANSDGSLTAQTVQIRPDDMPGFGGPPPAGQGGAAPRDGQPQP